MRKNKGGERWKPLHFGYTANKRRKGGIMSQFCHKCGTPLGDDQNFCGKCGTPKLQLKPSPVSASPFSDEKPSSQMKESVNAVNNEASTSGTNIEEMPFNHQEHYVPDEGFVEHFLNGQNGSRLNRWRYFKRDFCVLFVSGLVNMMIFSTFSDSSDKLTTVGNVCFFVVSAIVLFFEYNLDVRRLKDLGRGPLLAKINFFIGFAQIQLQLKKNMDFSDIIAMAAYGNHDGVLFALIAIMLVWFGIILYLMFVPGDRGPNQYGPDPLG